jgi:SagB-type dehydrogenase family enzyme
MPLGVLAAMLRAAGAPSPRDDGTGEPLEVALYCAVNAVEELARGVYRYDPERDALATVREGDVRMALQGAYHEKNVNLFAVPCAFFMVGDYPRCFERHGNRGYRVLNLHTGMMAQRLTLAAGAYDYSVRCLDGVNERAAEALLGLTPPEQALHLVPCFEDRGGDRFSATLLP